MSYRKIKEIYKTEKEHHKYKANKKMIKVYDRVEKMKRMNTNLFSLNKELMDIICEQNTHIDNMEKDLQVNDKLINKMSSEKKQFQSKHNNENETKIVLSIMLCWMLMIFMLQYNFIQESSFIIFNLCATISWLCIHMLY